MEERQNSSRARLPLIETVIIVAIFAVISVVLLNMYIAADRLQGKSVAKSRAVIELQNTAEELKQQVRSGETGPDGGTAAAMSASKGESAVCRCFDESWQETEDGRYRITVQTTVTEGNAGRLFEFTLCAEDAGNGEILAELSAAAYGK